jgi:hypothetical protein
MKLVIRCGVCGTELFSTAFIETLPEMEKIRFLAFLGGAKAFMNDDEAFKYTIAFSMGLRHFIDEHPDKLKELFKMEVEK